MKKIILILNILIMSLALQAQEMYVLNENNRLQLTQFGAEHLASLAFHCIQTEYPNSLGHVIVDSTQVRAPMDLHPAFYGCFDWHSSVHGHWMLVKLLKLFPEMKNAEAIRQALDQNMNAQNILDEVAYFKQPLHSSYERTYGWAWIFQLANELETWDNPQAKQWKTNLQPLVDHLKSSLISFLPKQTYPIRTGVHPNTAFALGFAYDYAELTKDTAFKNILIKRSREYYFDDKNYPAYLEPNGSDFFSPSLLEADLMHRILNPKEYEKWLDAFLPQIPENLLNPAIVSDRSDLQLVHLDGLNLSRAWCMLGIANQLPKSNKKKSVFTSIALKHLNDALPNIASGDYAGEHWLASFAVYA
ncbi:MAG TPA: DUF2891 domain-containing protein, partial [Bacteroidales bacterium]|nr:DUF2891 domain-containing protein [Bacteroidales bacterium]